MKNVPTDVEHLALYATIATLVVAVFTLFAVLRQIKIAVEQLALARRELKAVETDLEISQKAVKNAERRASLYVAEESKTFTDVPYQSVDDGHVYCGVDFILRVYNSGSKTATDFSISVGIPKQYEIHSNDWQPDQNVGKGQDEYSFYSRLVSGVRLFPFVAYRINVNGSILESEDTPKIPLVYRIVHEDGSYPHNLPLIYSVMTDQPMPAETREFQRYAPPPLLSQKHDPAFRPDDASPSQEESGDDVNQIKSRDCDRP